MKNYLTIMTLVLGCVFSAVAQTNKDIEFTEGKMTVQCADPVDVIADLTSDKYKELPIWSGDDPSGKLILMANDKTNTWTIIQFNGGRVCILGVGGNHTQIWNGPLV